MRVSLDARLAGYPGIGRFIVGLWGGLLELGAELTVLWPSYAVTDWLGHHGPEPIGPTRPIWARPFRIAEQVAVPWALRRAGVSVHHSPHLTLPYLSRVPVVLTVHDLFPYRDPRNARSSAAAAYYRWFMPRAVRAAAKSTKLSWRKMLFLVAGGGFGLLILAGLAVFLALRRRRKPRTT